MLNKPAGHFVHATTAFRLRPLGPLRSFAFALRMIASTPNRAPEARRVHRAHCLGAPGRFFAAEANRPSATNPRNDEDDPARTLSVLVDQRQRDRCPPITPWPPDLPSPPYLPKRRGGQGTAVQRCIGYAALDCPL